jgi:hypothetical protein
MSHFQVSQDLDESFSSVSRLGWVTFKSRKTLMRSGKKRNRKPKFQGDWGDISRGQGGKRDEKGQKKNFQFFSPHLRYVRWIDRTTARAAHVRSRAASLFKIHPPWSVGTLRHLLRIHPPHPHRDPHQSLTLRTNPPPPPHHSDSSQSTHTLKQMPEFCLPWRTCLVKDAVMSG